MKLSYKFILNKLLFLLFVLVFCFPRTLQFDKILILGLLFSFFLFKGKFIIFNSFKLIFIYVFIFLPPLILGILNQNDFGNITNAIRLNLVFPLLFYFLLQQFSKEELIEILDSSSYFSIILICLITFNSILYILDILPFNINSFFYPNEVTVGIHEGYFHIINSSLSYLLFIIPLYFNTKDKFNFKSISLYIFVFAFILAFISGRRILLLPFILSYLFVVEWLNLKTIVALSIFFFLFVVIAGSFFDFEIIKDRFLDALNSEGDSYVRKEQVDFFVKHIKEHPFLGHGLGSYMKDYKRSDLFDTAYEKTYYFYIYTLGIPFFIVLTVFYLKLGFNLYRIRDFFHFRNALLIATISILIASDTNPYWLSNFDYCLPLALLIRFSHIT